MGRLRLFNYEGKEYTMRQLADILNVSYSKLNQKYEYWGDMDTAIKKLNKETTVKTYDFCGEELTAEEIATRCGVTVTTVISSIRKYGKHKAIIRLKNRIERKKQSELKRNSVKERITEYDGITVYDHVYLANILRVSLAQAFKLAHDRVKPYKIKGKTFYSREQINELCEYKKMLDSGNARPIGALSKTELVKMYNITYDDIIEACDELNIIPQKIKEGGSAVHIFKVGEVKRILKYLEATPNKEYTVMQKTTVTDAMRKSHPLVTEDIFFNLEYFPDVSISYCEEA